MSKYKIGIVGIGPAGGVLAAHLANKGHDIILVDKLSDHMDEIKKNGLRITNYRELCVKFPQENICYSIKELKNRDVDTLFIAVKASLLTKVLLEIRSISKPDMTLISLQNGLDTEDLIAEFFGKENTLRIVVNFAGNLLGNGIIRMSFFNAPNYIGVLTPSTEEKAKDLAEIITDAGLETVFTPEIKKYEWEKSILNTMSPVCVITRKTMKEILEFKETRKIVGEIIHEGIEVAIARGIDFKPSFFNYCMGYLDKAGHHKVSMQADIEKGTPSEIEFLNGKIVEYGKIEGIPTPYNNIFTSLIRAIELQSFYQ
ncbi:MAG: ketopantoate reductase family protein [Promethearchaeota archaeon]